MTAEYIWAAVIGCIVGCSIGLVLVYLFCIWYFHYKDKG
jgi:hypothetical protein